MILREKARKRECERETDRQTDRQTGRQRDRERERERERLKECSGQQCYRSPFFLRSIDFDQRRWQTPHARFLKLDEKLTIVSLVGANF